jgi:GNAT superfamily N-acetyltransferase
MFVRVTQGDPLAAPLLGALAEEYSCRYGGTTERMMGWLTSHPADEFAPPHGGMVIGLLDGVPVTGGAFCRFDEQTAELKRIWTDSGHRRKGYAALLLAELEAAVAAVGYRRMYLTTGHRQPEAEALYAAAGFTRLAAPREPDWTTTVVSPIAFEKVLA